MPAVLHSAKAGRLREEFNFPFSFSALKLSRDKYFKCASIICISFLLHERNMTHNGKNGFLQFSIIFLGSLRIEGKASSYSRVRLFTHNIKYDKKN